MALWTVTCQALQSRRFSRQAYWNGLSCLPPGDLPDPGMDPSSLKSPALAGGLFTTSTTWEIPSLLKDSQICITIGRLFSTLLASSTFSFTEKVFPVSFLCISSGLGICFFEDMFCYTFSFFHGIWFMPGFWSILVTEWWCKEAYAI